MLDVSKFSSRCAVRALTEAAAGEVLAVCLGNPQYYEYAEARPTREQVVEDMRVTPPGVDASRKYYVGFYEGDTLVAVMDLIDGYPAADAAYIGFFMINAAYQSRGLGGAIIGEVAAYLKAAGKTSLRLGIDKDNPQSNHFWKKNSFRVIKEVERNGRALLVAERLL